jgi:hypothetical protein
MGNRESSPPSQPCDEMLASFLCSTNISDSLKDRSVSPLQFRSNNSLTLVLKEDGLDKIHKNVTKQIITEQMLIKIYNENQAKKQNDNIRVVENNNQKICSNQDKENISPSNVCLAKKTLSSNHKSNSPQSLLSFVFNGLGTNTR